MLNYTINEEDLETLLEGTLDAIREDKKTFYDLINLDGFLSREVCLGDITEGVGTSVAAQINFWNKMDEREGIPAELRQPIKLYIHSYGGDLLEAMIMIDTIKNSVTPVHAIVQGAAYSGGFFVAIACHKRYAYEHASFLFHEGSTGTSGTSGQFENYAKFYRVQLNQLRDIVFKYTALDEEWYKDHQKEDIWFTVEEAIKYGIIDEVYEESF